MLLEFALAVRQVRTPYMLVQQHDYVLQRPFDARQLLRTMAAHRAIKHVRLNTRGNIQRGFDGVIQNYTGHSHVPLRPSNPGAALTLHWSR